MGSNPFLVLKGRDEMFFKELKKILRLYSLNKAISPIPFLGGAVGYLAYDLGLLLEKKINKRVKPKSLIPCAHFGFYNSAVIFDHLRRLIHIFSIGWPEKKYHFAKLLAEENFKKTFKLVSLAVSSGPGKNNEAMKVRNLEFESNFSKEGYLAAIRKAKSYIKAGDVYQVNLSQQFRAKSNAKALEIYRNLRQLSPSFFSAYYDAGAFQILSSSPERFLELKNNIVTTVPMKGTRRRSANKSEDEALKKNLLKSEKDKAELMMIVDLERNDLGRVCNYNSVKVKKLRQVEKYNTVFQTTATVSGSLHQNKDRIDLIRACFPGGSITGCPKIRAMEIIDELEPSRRSIYTGNLGYLSFSGNMDFNILIRSILKKGNNLYFGAGGGIVADSISEEEYRETLVKAKAMMQSISRQV